VVQAEEGLRKSGGIYVESYQGSAAVPAVASPTVVEVADRGTNVRFDASAGPGDAVLDEIVGTRAELAQVRAEIAEMRETLKMWHLERQQEEPPPPVSPPTNPARGRWPHHRG
jgi:hypothetical protein